MADDRTMLDSDRVAEENRKLRQIGSRFKDAVSKIKADAQRYDGCWGGDELGQAFAKNYAPSATQTLKDVDTVQNNVTTVADNVDQVVKELRKIDQDHANRLRD